MLPDSGLATRLPHDHATALLSRTTCSVLRGGNLRASHNATAGCLLESTMVVTPVRADAARQIARCAAEYLDICPRSVDVRSWNIPRVASCKVSICRITSYAV